MKKLEGKIAVITGGNSGIGLSTAVEFSREGAKLVISGRDAKTLGTAAQTIGGEVLTVVADVSKLTDIDALIAAVKKKHGRIDVLFVNAGVARFESIAEFTEEHFDAMVDVNIKGAFFTVQKALPLLSQGASIIFTGSAAASAGQKSTSVYAATKAAVRSFARTMSAELMAKGIRVNTISPGPIETPIFGRMSSSKEETEKLVKHMASTVPLGRIGTPEEVARAAVFLASADSSFILGANIPVDGGKSQL